MITKCFYYPTTWFYAISFWFAINIFLGVFLWDFPKFFGIFGKIFSLVSFFICIYFFYKWWKLSRFQAKNPHFFEIQFSGDFFTFYDENRNYESQKIFYKNISKIDIYRKWNNYILKLYVENQEFLIKSENFITHRKMWFWKFCRILEQKTKNIFKNPLE